MLFEASEGAAGLQKSLDELCEKANQAVDDGYSILILTDRGVIKSAHRSRACSPPPPCTIT